MFYVPRKVLRKEETNFSDEWTNNFEISKVKVGFGPGQAQIPSQVATSLL